MIFEPFSIKGLPFKNRIVRSSIGGKTAHWDGTITSAFKNFEKRFAENEVAAIISATIAVDEKRASPLQYPVLSHDRFIKPLAEAVKAVQQYDCRYIIQIGDVGGHTQTSLFNEAEDAKSASTLFDFFFGYKTLHRAMSQEEIEIAIEKFGEAARRVRETGADGLEVTASKGYLIHQFLNPAVNRRTDQYGGSVEKRFRFLEEVVRTVRQKVGDDFLFGIRLSAADYNYLPLNIRLPLRFPLRQWYFGNTLKENLYYAQKLKTLGVDYLHIDKGFGFINPKGNPGAFPLHEIKLYYNGNRHLSFKAWMRSVLVNTIPEFILSPLANIGWKDIPAISADEARRFRDEIGLPVIANGGFQDRRLIEETLQAGKADLIAMARPLLANVNLVRLFKQGAFLPPNPCTHCNRCPVRTANFPLGCYDPSRFASQEEMEAQILEWSAASDERLAYQENANSMAEQLADK
ncbi:MAG: NADH:flavin oxidoreductase [Lewinellaceae bacterium]|nr:NADH:flavin oxidoreductase [Lewinellaceae bacterium]